MCGQEEVSLDVSIECDPLEDGEDGLQEVGATQAQFSLWRRIFSETLKTKMFSSGHYTLYG